MAKRSSPVASDLDLTLRDGLLRVQVLLEEYSRFFGNEVRLYAILITEPKWWKRYEDEFHLGEGEDNDQYPLIARPGWKPRSDAVPPPSAGRSDREPPVLHRQRLRARRPIGRSA